jgi:hypothetical protein
VPLRTDVSAGEAGTGQARRLLSLAAVLDGMSRKAAAEIGAMDRLRDWVHRFNAMGPAAEAPPLPTTGVRGRPYRPR